MSRLLTAPEMSHGDHFLLHAAGDLLEPVATAVWPGLAGVLASIANDPAYMRKVPADWVQYVMACLDPDVAAAAAEVDPRRCVEDALVARTRTRLALVAGSGRPAQRTTVVDEETRETAAHRLVAYTRQLVTAPGPPSTAEVETLVTSLQDRRVDVLSAFAELTALWDRADWTDIEQRLMVAPCLPSWVAASLLTARRVWGPAERGLFWHMSVGRDPRHHQGLLWYVIEAGPPALADDPDEATLAAEAHRAGADPTAFAWQLVRAAAGYMPTLLAAPAASPASRIEVEVEELGAALLWLVQSFPDSADVAAQGLEQLLGSLDATGFPTLHSSNLYRARWVFSRLHPHPRLRAGLGMFFRGSDGLRFWFSAASEVEVDLWLAYRRRWLPFTEAEVADFVRSGADAPAVVVDMLVRTTPGIIGPTRSPTLTQMVLEVLRGELGSDPARWRTALDLSGPDVSADELVAAVRAIHGPLSTPTQS